MCSEGFNTLIHYISGLLYLFNVINKENKLNMNMSFDCDERFITILVILLLYYSISYTHIFFFMLY